MKKKKTRRKTRKQKKRLKIRYDRIFLCLFLLFLIGTIVWGILNKPITNIYVSGNKHLKDQTIIDEAGLRNYPSTLTFSTMNISKKLMRHELIDRAKVYRTGFRSITIKIEEDTPLFYDKYKSKTVLSSGKKVKTKYEAPLLLNYTPVKIHKQLVANLTMIHDDVFSRISTIKYDPNEVDEGRFLISMSDGNYVYLSINKFDQLNNYIKIMRKFENKKGILYLDSGEYFKVMEG